MNVYKNTTCFSRWSVRKPNVDDLEKCFKKNKKDKIKKLKKQISDLSQKFTELNDKVKKLEIELLNYRNSGVLGERFIGDYPTQYGRNYFLRETTTTNNDKD